MLLLAGLCSVGFAARKALVIGNANYSEKKLANTINDARDIAVSLRGLGFEVRELQDLDKERFETAIDDFSRTLRSSDEAVFFFAGHGVQVGGLNYLIPVGAKIELENQVKYRAVDCNYILESLQLAEVSIVILDACRNNPYTWKRSDTRGLARMEGKPGSQFIIYSTAAGREADDGRGSTNSPFTTALKNQIARPNTEIYELMRNVINEVEAATNFGQTPSFYGSLRNPYYFAKAELSPVTPVTTTAPTVTPQTPQAQVIIHYGSILVSSNVEGEVYLDSIHQGRILAGTQLKLSSVQTGTRNVMFRAAGRSDSRHLTVEKNWETQVDFIFDLTPPGFVLVEGGSFQMGSDEGENDEKPLHQVTVSSFYIGYYEVMVGEFRQFVNATGYKTSAETGKGADIWTGSSWENKKDASWKNPYLTQSDNHPVTCVSWFDAIAYCNWRSVKEHLTPVYSIKGNNNPTDWSKGTVACDFQANGYRLPTEAEWEYAACGGTKSKGYIYSGTNDIGTVAWYGGNSGSNTHEVGTKFANELGIFDMSGNVWEWCWDWYDGGYYETSPASDPKGPVSGSYRVLRGGSWYDRSRDCRVTFRNNGYPGLRLNYGLRLVRTIL